MQNLSSHPNPTKPNQTKPPNHKNKKKKKQKKLQRLQDGGEGSKGLDYYNEEEMSLVTEINEYSDRNPNRQKPKK
jgi:hypothetical protein